MENVKKPKNKFNQVQVFISTILTIAIFVIVAIIMSCGIALVFKVDIYFWAGTIGSTIAVLLTFITWCPTGEQLALNLANVQNGKILYDNRANYIVDHQMFDLLKQFCDKKNKDLEKDIVTELLSTQVIEYRVYELYINKDRNEEEERLYNRLWDNLTDSQKKYVTKLASKQVKFERLTPRNITIGKTSKHAIVNHNREQVYKGLRLATKSIWGVFTTCFTYFVVITPNKNFGIPQVVMITMWFFTFLMAIYTAIRTGYKSVATYRHTYNLEQAELCAEFLTFARQQDSSVEDIKTVDSLAEFKEEKKKDESK